VIKDFKWGLADGKWRVVDTPVGEGMVDFPAYYRLVKELGVAAGPVVMHFEYPHEQNRETVMLLMRADLNRLRGYLGEAGLL
jgi:sugar phosphate isomerase/epimerase